MNKEKPAKAFQVDHRSEKRQELEGRLETGLMAGIVSAAPIAVLLALGAVIAGHAAATPFYAIVWILAPAPLRDALRAESEGLTPTFYQMQFTGGLGICLVMCAISGLVFALGTRNHDVRGAMRYVLGALHGVVMMCLFYLGALQLVGALADLDVSEASLAALIGWPMVVLAHMAHGVSLAWLTKWRLLQPREVFATPG